MNGHWIFRAFFGSGLSRICSLWLLLVVAAATVGLTITPWDPTAVDWDALESAPDASHWFGTDLIGRDLLARIMLGARVSLSVALIATGVSVVIGIPYGTLSGYLGGRVDQVMMRLVDTLYALPFILIVILLVVVFGRNTLLLFAALGAVFWLDIARIVRGQTLRIRESEFIAAARSLGATQTHILFKHVVPNVLGPAVVYATLTMPGVILAESFMSFLGLGVQEPATSWGVLIADGTPEHGVCALGAVVSGRGAGIDRLVAEHARGPAAGSAGHTESAVIIARPHTSGTHYDCLSGSGYRQLPFANADAFWEWVDLCEDSGVDSLWQSDRIIGTEPNLECLSVMAALAGRTRRMKFGMNVASLGLRDPVLTAKACATIDVLSNGRLLPAFGVGSARSRD